MGATLGITWTEGMTATKCSVVPTGRPTVLLPTAVTVMETCLMAVRGQTGIPLSLSTLSRTLVGDTSPYPIQTLTLRQAKTSLVEIHSPSTVGIGP